MDIESIIGMTAETPTLALAMAAAVLLMLVTSRGCLRLAWATWRATVLVVTVATIYVHGPEWGVPKTAVRIACAVEVCAWFFNGRAHAPGSTRAMEKMSEDLRAIRKALGVKCG